MVKYFFIICLCFCSCAQKKEKILNRSNIERLIGPAMIESHTGVLGDKNNFSVSLYKDYIIYYDIDDRVLEIKANKQRNNNGSD